MTEPASLHPVVDPTRCIGSGGCEHACPEGALGVVGGKAVLTNPTLCIGHGACADSCPVSAITLVFGSERRGVDIPQVDPKFETNVPGVFIVGELGGMGLIRKAAMQGRQAMSTIAGRKRGAAPYDVVIVGAGPAGIAAGLGAVEAKLRYVLLEQEPDLGGSVFHFPRNKVAMTAPVDLPLVGRMKFNEVSKEALLEFWKRIIGQAGVAIRFGERMEKLEARPERPSRGHRPRGLRGDRRRAGNRPPRHAAHARRSRRGAAEGRLPAGRRRAVPTAAGAGGRRRRQRGRSRARLRGRARHRGHARVPRRRVQPPQAGQPRPPRAGRGRSAGCAC